MALDHNLILKRLRFARVAVCACMGILVVRLWYVQCLYGSYYRDLSENNRTRTIRTAAPRGSIYDRHGRVLVRSRAAFNVALMVEDTPDVPGALKSIAEITGRDPVKVKEQFASQNQGRPFEPKVVLYDISREDLAKIKVNSHRLPGVIITTIPTRLYPQLSLASQMFGYSREISKAQLDSRKDLGYRMGDVMGQTGVERLYEDQLRGAAGYTLVEVDARGNRRGELGIVDDQPGSDLYLTIDMDLQRVAEEGLGPKRGAVVALDPRNGEVLVLASTPTFDGNIFSGQMLADEWERLRRDPNHPLNNRAISSAYPPGSTFKLLWSVAALSEGVITPATEFNCPGYYMLGRRAYRCHKKSGHGLVNLQTAVTVSCNAYFYQVGQALNINRMSHYMELFGVGNRTEIDLPAEETGIRPSDPWKRARYGEKWYPGDTLPVAIGQGYVVVTPLQMATVIGTIANGGTIHRPRLVKKVVNPRTGETTESQPEVVRNLPIDPAIFEKVRQYAVQVVAGKRGTGRRAALPGISIGGKTGTAQASALGKESLGERFKDHAWFIAFAPAENPNIAMAVIVENTGHGGEFAAPIARQIMEVHFRKLGLLKETLPEPAPAEPAEEETSEGAGEPAEPGAEAREGVPEGAVEGEPRQAAPADAGQGESLPQSASAAAAGAALIVPGG